MRSSTIALTPFGQLLAQVVVAASTAVKHGTSGLILVPPWLVFGVVPVATLMAAVVAVAKQETAPVDSNVPVGVSHQTH